MNTEKKFKYKFTVILPDETIIHSTCKNAPGLYATRYKYAKMTLKARYGKNCNIVECKPDSECCYPKFSDSAAINRYL